MQQLFKTQGYLAPSLRTVRLNIGHHFSAIHARSGAGLPSGGRPLREGAHDARGHRGDAASSAQDAAGHSGRLHRYSPSIPKTRNKHLGCEYLAVLETDNATPYYLNLHNREVAHMLALGATGSAKSFLCNFLLQNAQKYQPETYIFDIRGGLLDQSILAGGQEHAEKHTHIRSTFRMIRR